MDKLIKHNIPRTINILIIMFFLFAINVFAASKFKLYQSKNITRPYMVTNADNKKVLKQWEGIVS